MTKETLFRPQGEVAEHVCRLQSNDLLWFSICVSFKFFSISYQLNVLHDFLGAGSEQTSISN
jgi:hypothetical protein